MSELIPYKPLEVGLTSQVNWPLPSVNVYPPSPESVLASKVDRDDAVSLLSQSLSVKESIELARERTKRHQYDSLAEIQRIQARSQFSLARIQAERDIQLARRSMVTSIVTTAIAHSTPRPVNYIEITERRGRFWNNFDYKWTIKIL